MGQYSWYSSVEPGPMKTPSGAIFFLDYKYGDLDKAKVKELVDKYYARRKRQYSDDINKD